MSFGVVCVSRTVAAGGETIGQTVAQQLGFRYVDDQIITKAAQLAQVAPALVAATEHRQSLLQRVVAKLPLVSEIAASVSQATGLPLDAVLPGTSRTRAQPDDMRALIRAAIHEVAKAGRAVIVAHAASMALRRADGVLRVLVTASADIRARRLATAEHLDAEKAAAAVANSDRERLAYFQTFYEINEELPTHYDLVINTDAFSPEDVVEIIVATASGPR